MSIISTTQSQKEIMERIPDLFSKVGIILLVSIIFILFLLSFYIRFPDTLSGKATLNSTNPAISLVMPSSGKIKLLVFPKTIVKDKEAIAVVDNSANYEDVFFVKKVLSNFYKIDSNEYKDIYAKLSIDLELGEVKSAYIKFLIALKAVINQNNIRIYEQEIKSLTDKLNINNDNLKKKRDILSIMETKLYYSKESMTRDSLLFIKNVLSRENYESSKVAYLQQVMQYQDFFLNLRNDKKDILLIKNNIEQVNLQIAKESDAIYNSLIDSYIELVAIIESWEKKYLITSPIVGLLEYVSFFKSNQYVTQNTLLFNIMPDDLVSEVEVILPSDGVGKVCKGQRAIIKLSDYPSKEYGDLTGRVTEISLSKLSKENENLSLIKVKLDNDGCTNYGYKIRLYYGMPASVNIITDNKRLISRIFERFKYSIISSPATD